MKYFYYKKIANCLADVNFYASAFHRYMDSDEMTQCIEHIQESIQNLTDNYADFIQKKDAELLLEECEKLYLQESFTGVFRSLKIINHKMEYYKKKIPYLARGIKLTKFHLSYLECFILWIILIFSMFII